MSDLRTIALEDGLETLIDYRGKSPPKSPVGIPVISAKVVKAGRVTHPIEQKISTSYYPIWMTRGLPQPGDVVLTTEGPLGEVAQLGGETAGYALGQRIVCLRGRYGVVDGTFLKFLLMSPIQQSILAGFATGTTVAGISQKALRTIPITIPPYDEQVAIGGLLGALDDKIDLNRRMNETLEAMARVIFKDWFVNFGPTRAKMEGRPPYLAPNLWALFPDRLDDAGKPEGWAEGNLLQYATLNAETWTKSAYPEAIEYVDLSGTKWGYVQETSIFPRQETPSRAQRVLRTADTIVGTVRPGNGSFALIGRDGLTGSTGFAALRPNNLFLRELVYLAATEKGNIERLAHLADGGAYPAVRPDVVATTEIWHVDEATIRAFHHLTAPLLDQLLDHDKESRTLAAIRDLLLPKLMSGEVRVEEAESLLGAVA